MHANYLETFASYRNEVEKSKLDIEGLISKIQNDSSFTQNLRSNVTNALDFNNEAVRDFVSAIQEYILFPEESLNISVTPYSNVPRISLIMALRQLQDQAFTENSTVNLIALVKESLAPQNPHTFDLPSVPPKPPSYLVEQLMSFSGLADIKTRSQTLEQDNKSIESSHLSVEQKAVMQKYLACRYVDFIIQTLNERYDAVVRQYWKTKLKLLGLDCV